MLFFFKKEKDYEITQYRLHLNKNNRWGSRVKKLLTPIAILQVEKARGSSYQNPFTVCFGGG